MRYFLLFCSKILPGCVLFKMSEKMIDSLTRKYYLRYTLGISHLRYISGVSNIYI